MKDTLSDSVQTLAPLREWCSKAAASWACFQLMARRVVSGSSGEGCKGRVGPRWARGARRLLRHVLCPKIAMDGGSERTQGTYKTDVFADVGFPEVKGSA